MTSSQRTQRVTELVKLAMDRPRSEQAAFLDEACAGDEELRAEVDSLVRYQDDASQFIEHGALAVAAETLAHHSAASLPRQIEEYEIISRIGVGGMGEVCLAHDTKLRRKVALKLIRAGMDTGEIVARFRQEERILASLNHPNIAQLYDAGVTAGDVPFFAMEHVEGVRIDAYCTAHALSTAARLQLFRKVCGAVHYAHQRLVIHRDLKPSNVLVTSDGEPKLLDFGIAKLVEGQDGVTQMPTLAGAMTPDYASPEQVRGEAVTTATDVYSLGVLLYELLTGQRPYRLKTRSPDEIARAITDQEPERPSTAGTKVEQPPPLLPDARSLRGDIDNIVLMALRKEPARRYASVGQFSEDVRRYLEGLPVIAHKDTVSYRARKFVRRNKIGVAAATAIALALLGGIIATTWQARRATEQARVAAQERDRARVEAAKSARINEFLQHVLGYSQVSWLSPNPLKKNVSTIAEALDEASRRAARELADQPEILAAVHLTLGNSYSAQGNMDLALQHLRASLDLRRKILGPEHPDTAGGISALAEQLINQGNYAEAETLAREAVDIYRRRGPQGVDRRSFTIALNALGVAMGYKGDSKAAEALCLEAIEVGADLTGQDRGVIAILLGNIAVQRGNQGDVDAAVDYLRKSIEEMRRLPDKPLSNLAIALSNLGSFLTIKGEHTQADAVLREALQLNQQTVGEKHLFTVMALIYLAVNDYEQTNFPKALEEVNRALALQREILPEGHIDFARTKTILGNILTRTGELARAEEHLRSALALRVKALKPGHTATAGTQGALGENLLAQNRFEEAEPLLLESHSALHKAFSATDSRTQKARARLATLYDAWGKPEAAAKYR